MASLTLAIHSIHHINHFDNDSSELEQMEQNLSNLLNASSKKMVPVIMGVLKSGGMNSTTGDAISQEEVEEEEEEEHEESEIDTETFEMGNETEETFEDDAMEIGDLVLPIPSNLSLW